MKTSPELRALRKLSPLPISRQAYTKIYEKTKEVLETLASSGIPDIGTIETLFGMLAASFTDAPKPQPGDAPVLYSVYICLLADVEAARRRSVAARERAEKRAAEKRAAAEKPDDEKPADEKSADEKPKPRKPAPEPQPVRYRYGIPVKAPASISQKNWVYPD